MKNPAILLAVLVLFVATTPGGAATRGADIQPPSVSFLVASALVDDEPVKRPEPLVVVKPEPVFDPTPRVGSRGPEVLAIEERLAALHYMAGKVDGIFDGATSHGVIAFQKVEGLARNGRGDGPTLARLASAGIPVPRYATPPDHLEIDIARQVVLVVRGGKVASILPTSTGSNKMFTNQGYTRRAITPNGTFKITRKINALRISPLGELYKPSYFNGGIAFHGNGSVPIYPASHGCVRLPMPFADWFFNNASPIGMFVYAYGGPTGPNPQPYIDDKPAPSPSPSPSPTPSPSPSPTATPSVTTTATPGP